MLHAYDEHGRLTTIYQNSPAVLKKLKKNAEFFCPTCNETLIIRFGRKVTPHFAHLPSSTCEVKSRGESTYHEGGKWLLYQWLNNQGYQVVVEPYLSEINQRPDILLTIDGKKAAIELQCASIPAKDVMNRTQGYRKAGIFPLWILGRNQLKRKGKYILQLDQFHKEMIYSFQSQYCMYYLDVEGKAIITAGQIRGASLTTSFSTFQTTPLPHIKFPHLFKPSYSSIHPFYLMWEKQMYQFRTVYRNAASMSKERNWRQMLYLRGYHYSLIPSACYLPVRNQQFCEEAPYVWQSRFILQYYMPRSIGDVITFPHKYLRSAVNAGQSDSIYKEYLLQLGKLGYVEEREGNWIKKREILFHTHSEKAVKEDKQIMNKLKLKQEF
ncbi:competence protein CoiA [Halobacillus sp. A5]|uniref:competence protein CoiA n=1 Tax=Halobacillus sp. A5 TaxID=2880263 RepID=UPI0020A6C403|nr:competence protein CoiA family protein [Halobacillus sp. A5]MCP3026673.1 competence protein CoiA [Halobacillus sp. A5]